MAIVDGEIGVGKTHLLKLFAEEAAVDAVVAWGRAWEAADAPAFWPVIQALRSLADQVSPNDLAAALAPEAHPVVRLVPELATIADFDPGPVDRAGGRVALFQGVGAFLRTLSATSPLVVILEDVHAADEDTLLMLSFLLDHLDRGRVLVVATVEVPHRRALLAEIASRALRVDLRPLTEAGVRQLYEEETGEQPTDAVVSALHEASEGNPLFVKEAIRLLIRDGSLRRPDQSMGFRVPQGARAVLRKRLAKLSDQATTVLAVGAVLGREFEAAAVSEILGGSTNHVLDRVAEAVEVGVVREISSLGRFAFAHVLFREVLYEDLSTSDRMRLHHAALEAIERRYEDRLDDHLDQLAHHSFKAAQAADAAKTIDYTLRAAEAAAASTAYDKAARLYQRALKIGDLGGMPKPKRREVEAALQRTQERAASDESASAPEESPSANSFTRVGDYWRIAYEGGELQLKDSKGLKYLALLLASAGQPLHALELVTLETNSLDAKPDRGSGRDSGKSFVETSTDLGATLDWRAKSEYRDRLLQLQEDLAEAEAFNDTERAAKAQIEMDALIQQLEQGLGFGGRQRKPEAERARTSVTKAIKGAIAKIEEHHPALGRHLQVTVRTGTLCSYQPDPRADPSWHLE